MNPVTERIFQLTFDIAKVPTDKNHRYKPAPQFTYLGRVWTGDLLLHSNNMLSVYLDTSDLTKSMSLAYGVRIVCGDLVHEKPAKVCEYKQGVFSSTCFGPVIPWDELLAKFCTNGQFTIEYVFPTPSLPQVPSSTLKEAVFKDIWVACKDNDDKVHCNKCIIGRESQAMFAAFDNETSEESLTKTFTIRHPCATVENVLLYVRCMYEGWLSGLMDPHAKELLILADCYESVRIAALAMDALKRQLAPISFWETTAVAVLLQVPQPSLIEACAKFADALPNGLSDMVNREDCGDKDAVYGIVKAIAKLHKK